ncbi:hypothetical protein ACET3Z_012873 [Daucus carota]
MHSVPSPQEVENGDEDDADGELNWEVILMGYGDDSAQCWSLGSVVRPGEQNAVAGIVTKRGFGGQIKLHPGGPSDPLGLADDLDQAALLQVKEVKKTCNVVGG